MSYSERPWKERLAIMGDQAEGIFAEEAPLGKFERFGWRRPGIRMARMSERIRYMPDYFTESGHLVEVMGCGKDGTLKVRPEKWEGLKWWNTSGNPVVLFIWNSHLRLYALITWSEAKRLVTKARNAGLGEFSDGNAYLPIEWAWIEAMCLVREARG